MPLDSTSVFTLQAFILSWQTHAWDETFPFLPYLHSYLHLASMLPFSIVSTLCLLMESSVNNVLANDIISALILNLRISIYYYRTYISEISFLFRMMMMMRKEGIRRRKKWKKKISIEYSMWKNLHAWKFVCMLSAQKWKDEFFSILFCSLLLLLFFVMCEFFSCSVSFSL